MIVKPNFQNFQMGYLEIGDPNITISILKTKKVMTLKVLRKYICPL
ncbi:hypothetical protein CKA32_005026 [Geitlerinema sp. FC II]|nr:hypothetical protein CKA32_005026 [Geitlerinema sp. FC II]